MRRKKGVGSIVKQKKSPCFCLFSSYVLRDAISLEHSTITYNTSTVFARGSPAFAFPIQFHSFFPSCWPFFFSFPIFQLIFSSILFSLIPFSSPFSSTSQACGQAWLRHPCRVRLGISQAWRSWVGQLISQMRSSLAPLTDVQSPGPSCWKC